MTEQTGNHIIHIAPYYPPHLGGLERMAQMAAEGAAGRGYPVQVITSTSSGIARGSHVRNGVKVTSLGSFECAKTPIAPTLFFHLLRLPNASLLHLHLAQAYFPELVLLAARLKKFPLVVHFHLDVAPSGTFGALFVLYKKLVWKPLLRHATRVIVCSSEQAALVHSKYGAREENIVVLPNAVSDVFFEERDYQPHQDALRLLYVGRLVHQKRIERCIEAVAKLTIPYHLTIIGEGDERGWLESLVAASQLHAVTFEGQKGEEDLHRYHRENDVLILTSDREGGTPLVVLEAMAGGLPVVATNVTGVRDLLADCGVLIDEPYAESLARALERLWKSPETLAQLSRNGIEKAREYRQEAYITRLVALYDALRSSTQRQ